MRGVSKCGVGSVLCSEQFSNVPFLIVITNKRFYENGQTHELKPNLFPQLLFKANPPIKSIAPVRDK